MPDYPDLSAVRMVLDLVGEASELLQEAAGIAKGQAEKLQDADFRARLNSAVERNREALDLLAK